MTRRGVGIFRSFERSVNELKPHKHRNYKTPLHSSFVLHFFAVQRQFFSEPGNIGEQKRKLFQLSFLHWRDANRSRRLQHRYDGSHALLSEVLFAFVAHVKFSDPVQKGKFYAGLRPEHRFHTRCFLQGGPTRGFAPTSTRAKPWICSHCKAGGPNPGSVPVSRG